jgi:hypothetical protein
MSANMYGSVWSKDTVELYGGSILDAMQIGKR